jgi:hypothetical protein
MGRMQRGKGEGNRVRRKATDEGGRNKAKEKGNGLRSRATG